MPRRTRGPLLAALLSAAVLALPGQALAATINVNTTTDETTAGGTCSLREAVIAANTNVSGGSGCVAGDTIITDTIVVPANAAHYTLSIGGANEDNAATGDLDLKSSTGAVIISGGGASSTVIDTTGLGDRVFEVLLGTAELRDLTVTGGEFVTPDPAADGPDQTGNAGQSSTGSEGPDGTNGGGIANAATLTLTRVTVTENTAGSAGAGGNGGTGGDGGASQNGGASTGGGGGFGGHGGGIENEGGTLHIVDSTISSNFAGNGGDAGNGGQGGKGGSGSTGLEGGASTGGQGGGGGNGGGLYQDGGTTTLTRTEVSDNTAGDAGQGGNGDSGGLGGDGTSGAGGTGGSSTGGGSNFAGFGGGIDMESGQITITDSTVRDNTAGFGGIGGAGGPGGNGGTGTSGQGAGGNSVGGHGGNGGSSGGFSGFGSQQNIDHSAIVSNNAGAGSDGGNGGAGGAGGTPGSSTGGDGGGGGGNGGVSLLGSSSPQLTNVTVAENVAGDSGTGGDGGTGPNDSTSGDGGNGGGNAGITVTDSSTSVTITHATVASNDIGDGAPPGVMGSGSGTNTTGSPGAQGVKGGVVGTGTNNVTLRNSIVADNDDKQCAGVITDGGHNLSFPNDLSCPATLHGNPLLGPVQDNGGPSPTMMLGTGSPAIDKVPTNPFSNCTADDQRHLSRPKGAGCDIGALEKSAPKATTGGSSAVTASAAHVAGTVNPQQRPTSYRFQFGKTAAYGSQTALVAVGKGTSNVTAGANLTGLDPNTIYHYRVVATNGDGTTNGADKTFTTEPGPFPGVKILTKRARLDRKRRAKIKLSCPAAVFTKDTCAGTLTLTAKIKVKKGKKKKRKTIKLGKASFSIPAGGSLTLRVKISKRGAKLIAKKRKLKAKAIALATDGRGGTPVTTTKKVTLKPPKRKKHKKH